MTVHGASVATIRQAIADGDPLAGTRGFAGRLPDGRLVRDVLGRYPLFSESTNPDQWSFSPTDLDDPDPVPAGHVRTAEGDRRIWQVPDPEPERDRRAAVEHVERAIRESVREVNADGLAVAFSGGVDSSIVAALCGRPAYVVGFPGSHDLAIAESTARAMGIDLRTVELTPAGLEATVPEVARAIGRTNAMDVGIALPLFFAAHQASADGFDRLAVGQGADELFGGYDKLVDPASDHRVDADSVRGARRELLDTVPDQLARDVLAIRAGGVEPVVPLLDDRVVRSALELPGEMLVNRRGERKWALRLASRAFVPDRVAFREKKAVQYGSLVARELDRLARQSGFKRQVGDHVRKYVESRL